jgi:phage terminase small subunit
MKLTAKEARFVEEYLVDLNATAALLRAGYRVKNKDVAAVCAHRLLRKSKVQSAIASRMQDFTQRADADLEKVLTAARRIAFADPRKLFDESGNMKPIAALDDEIAFAIAGIEIEEIEQDGKKIGVRTKVRLNDRNSGLDKLFRYHALYKDPGSKDNPLHIYHADLSKLSLDQLAKIRDNPELILSTAN